MVATSFRIAARTLVAGSLLLGSAVAAPAVLADDDDDRFATYIYAGTIDDLDNATVVEDIDNLQIDDDDDRDQYWAVLGDGQALPDELYTGNEDLSEDIDLETLTSEPHLVVVHETDDPDSAIVAVGTIDGDVAGDGTLLIQLEENEGSGWEGRAWFGPDLDDDDGRNDDADDDSSTDSDDDSDSDTDSDGDSDDDDSDADTADGEELDVVVGVFPAGTVDPLTSSAPIG